MYRYIQQTDPSFVVIENVKENVDVEVAFQYNDGYQENVFSFVNNISTIEEQGANIHR